MKAYSLIQFLSEPISTIIENDDDYSFEYRNSEIGKTNSVGQFISRIKIPLIQRDYAQGRSSNKSLREEFLKNIFKYLEEEKELKLDFVYGSIERENDEINFLPLDGQQRLTTLFLLHWYIIKKECNADEIKNFQNGFLKKFSYETRDTSRRFFINLADFDFLDNPKLEIEKEYWFSNYFKLDPTVSATVNTLETIHVLYNTSTYRGQLLSRLDLIVFYVLPMDQFKLTDDLYIKLNARGKVLSSFENFKADIIGFIKKYNRYQIEKEFSGLKLYSYDIIANKFDNKWADFFWKKTRNDESNKSIDGYFFRFIHKVLINEYLVLFNKKSNINNDPTYKTLLEKEKGLLYSTFDFYKKKEFLKSLKDFERLLDFYSKYSDLISSLIQPSWDENYQWDIFKSEFTMDDRMVFDAINSYALENEHFDAKKFKDWIRVVWNIIIDPDIRSIEANKVAMTFVRRISVYSSDILQNLKEGNLDDIINESKGIHSVQLKEEKEKATLLLLSDIQWNNSIHNAEKHKMLQGNISVLLEISDLPQELESFLHVFESIFSENNSVDFIPNESYVLMRYVISTFKNWGDINSFNFSNSNLNWRTYLRRHRVVKLAIQNLLKLDSEDISTYVSNSINGNSLLVSENIIEKISVKNLYSDNDFHKWMQADGVNKIKWLNHHYFAIRPSAWYSKVMIDCYRNELINQIVDHFKINTLNDHQCANSNYYWGESIELNKITSDYNISFVFDNNKTLTIGLKLENNSFTTLGTEEELIDQIWSEKHDFDYSKVSDITKIDDFIEDIKEKMKESTFNEQLFNTN